MNRRAMLAGLAVALCAATPLLAQDQPIQVALFTPVQIVPENEGVSGLRLNFIYSVNRSVKYVDLGLVNVTTGGPSEGVQWAFVSINRGSFTGWQYSFAAVTQGDFEGLQSGWFTSAAAGKGVQWGVVNTARSWRGLQFGLVNYTQNLYGVQVGLINIIKTGGVAPVLPIVNWSF
jgi:hypothetical protein